MAALRLPSGAERPGQVVLGDRPALDLVGVEQVRRRPSPWSTHASFQPRSNPSGHGGVQAGAAAWRHPVGGVADEEDVAGAEPVGDRAREGERADALDRGPSDPVDAGAGPDDVDEAGSSVYVAATRSPVRVPVEAVDPAVAARRPGSTVARRRACVTK